MIIFARHGQTILGKEDRFEGVTNSSLTDFGRLQAQLLGGHFVGKRFNRLLVSARGRARETASIVTKVLNIEAEVELRLTEMCYGEWEEKKRSECRLLPLWSDREKDLFHFQHPGFFKSYQGESYSDEYNRLLPLFLELSQEKGDILTVSHSGVLRCARKFFEKISDEEFKNAKYPNSVYYSVEKYKSDYKTRLFDVAKNYTLSV